MGLGWARGGAGLPRKADPRPHGDTTQAGLREAQPRHLSSPQTGFLTWSRRLPAGRQAWN